MQSKTTNLLRIPSPLATQLSTTSRLDVAARRTRSIREHRKRVAVIEEIQSRRAGYTEFYDRYDALIGLLCSAAQEGTKPAHEKKYQECRTWFRGKYPEYKMYIRSYIDEASKFCPCESSRKLNCDPFEALYSHGSVTTMLLKDGGNLIDLLTFTQAVLYSWDNSLVVYEKASALSIPYSDFRNARFYQN